MSETYFQRYAYPKRFIHDPIVAGTFITVVIPCFKEENVIPTLQSLIECTPTKHPVEVIWVINHPENADEEVRKQSLKTIDEIERFLSEHDTTLSIHIIKAFDLPSKKAGVGLARKIGMDEAAYRFNSIDQDGIILCFDADSTCQSNYLAEVEQHFIDKSNSVGASIHYEHPIHLEHGALNEAIILYELHLRFYIQSLKFTGYPHAFHTIGSSMAVRSSIYQKQGGMNKRKAGEDFYFLHKVIPLGDFHNITSTKVIPSARISDRVPFGTGRAMQEHQNETKDLSLSYDFDCFKLIKTFLDGIHLDTKVDQLPSEISEFLQMSDLQEELENVKAQAKDERHFKIRFFAWFNGFKMLKLVHFLRDKYYPEKSLVEQASLLLTENGLSSDKKFSAYELLVRYRDLDMKDGNT